MSKQWDRGTKCFVKARGLDGSEKVTTWQTLELDSKGSKILVGVDLGKKAEAEAGNMAGGLTTIVVSCGEDERLMALLEAKSSALTGAASSSEPARMLQFDPRQALRSFI